MRFKIVLTVNPKYGLVMPISYQNELTQALHGLITADRQDYESWLYYNGFVPADNEKQRLYLVSNLYIPKIHTQEDRLKVSVPRIQFWFSCLPEKGTREFLDRVLFDHEVILGDAVSRMAFTITAIEDISPIEYLPEMEYQSLSPVSVIGVRPNRTIEFLNPQSPFFRQFIIDELIERWERVYGKPYTGSREFLYEPLQPERRKAITILESYREPRKIVGYSLKFRLTLAPELQQFAYVCGIGDNIKYGFGFIELLKKSK